MEEISTLDVRVRELELFKNMPTDFVHTYFDLRISGFGRYLVSLKHAQPQGQSLYHYGIQTCMQ